MVLLLLWLLVVSLCDIDEITFVSLIGIDMKRPSSSHLSVVVNDLSKFVSVGFTACSSGAVLFIDSSCGVTRLFTTSLSLLLSVVRSSTLQLLSAHRKRCIGLRKEGMTCSALTSSNSDEVDRAAGSFMSSSLKTWDIDVEDTLVLSSS